MNRVLTPRLGCPIMAPRSPQRGPKRRNEMSTVLLSSGTVGTTAVNASVGDTVTVELHDENGMPINDSGEVVEVLE